MAQNTAMVRVKGQTLRRTIHQMLLVTCKKHIKQRQVMWFTNQFHFINPFMIIWIKMWFLLYCEELNYWNEKGVAESTIIAEVKTFVTNSKANPGKCMQIAYSKTVVTTMQCANHYNIFIDWFSNWCRSS